jgi:hypothetical protein
MMLKIQSIMKRQLNKKTKKMYQVIQRFYIKYLIKNIVLFNLIQKIKLWNIKKKWTLLMRSLKYLPLI